MKNRLHQFNARSGSLVLHADDSFPFLCQDLLHSFSHCLAALPCGIQIPLPPPLFFLLLVLLQISLLGVSTPMLHQVFALAHDTCLLFRNKSSLRTSVGYEAMTAHPFQFHDTDLDTYTYILASYYRASVRYSVAYQTRWHPCSGAPLLSI